MDMKAAFFFTVVFPPPAAGSKIFSRSDGPGTGLTADADKTFVMQAVVGNIILLNVSPGLVSGPV